MLISNIEVLLGVKLKKHLGIVQGSTVRTKPCTKEGLFKIIIGGVGRSK